MTLRSCDANGRVLRGDRPHAPLDLAFEATLDQAADPENPTALLTVWSTFTNHTAGRNHYIFSTDEVEVYPKDLLLGDPKQTYLAVTIAATPAPSTGADTVTWGSTGTVTAVSPTTPLKLAPASGGGSAKDGVVPFVYTMLCVSLFSGHLHERQGQ